MLKKEKMTRHERDKPIETDKTESLRNHEGKIHG